MSILIITVGFAQDTVQCKLDGESVPSWICNNPKNTNKVSMVVGSGHLLFEAVAEALAAIGFNYNAEIRKTYGIKSENKKSNIKSTKEFTKILYGKNIEVRAKNEMFTHAEKHSIENFLIHTVKLFINTNEKNAQVLTFEFFTKDVSTRDKYSRDILDENMEYSMNIEGKYKLNITQEFEKAGITILKTYTDSSLKQYVLIRVDNDKITKK